MADGVAAALCGCAGLWFEVGHGMDARHAGVLSARSHPSQISPQQADLSDALWVHRKFCAASFARRSRIWQGIADRQYPVHSGLQRWVEQLNRVYREFPALHDLDNDPAGFEWIDCNDNETSTISLLRKGKSSRDKIVVVCNFTPVPRLGYRLGVPSEGFWRELLNSDATEYGGSGMGNLG